MDQQTKINNFRMKAKKAGFTDAEIERELQKRLNTQQQTVSTRQNEITNQQNTVYDKPQENFVSSFVKELVRPAIDYTKLAGEGVVSYGRLASAGLNKLTGGDFTGTKRGAIGAPITGEEKPVFLSQKESQEYLKNPILKTAKTIAGAESYLVPFGRGSNIVTKAIIPGAVSSGMFEASQKESTPESVLNASLTGGVTAGVLGKGIKAISPVAKSIGTKFSGIAEKTQLAQYVKSLGQKPISREGGAGLLMRMQKIGIKPGNPQEIIEQADNLIAENGDKLINGIKQLKDKIPASKIIDYLEKKIKSSASVVTKRPIEDVLAIIKADIGTRKFLTPEDLYILKSEYGDLGKWTAQSSAIEKKAAEIWRDIYMMSNNLIDESLKKAGNQEFRQLNDVIHTAMQTKQYAGRVGNIAPNKATLGLLDIVTAGGGVATGQLPAALAAMVARRAIESSTGTKVIGKGLETAGNILSKTPEMAVGETISKISSIVGGQSGKELLGSGQIAVPRDQIQSQTKDEPLHKNIISETEQPIKKSTTVAPSPTNPFGNLSKRQVLALALSQGAKASDLKELSDVYDMISADQESISSETQNTANALRTEYFKRTTENGFLEVTNAYNKVASASNTAAGDVSLIFAYMKILDPGSVVREGEFANAQNTAGIPDQIRNMYNKAISGQRLSDQQRNAFKSEAQTVYQQYKNSQAQIDSFYQGLAQRYGIDPSLVGIGTFNQ